MVTQTTRDVAQTRPAATNEARAAAQFEEPLYAHIGGMPRATANPMDTRDIVDRDDRTRVHS